MNITSIDGLLITNFPEHDLWALKGKRGEKERCAVIMGKVSKLPGKDILAVHALVEVDNSAEDVTNHFVMSGHSILDAVKAYPKIIFGASIIGFIHTHLDGGPDPSVDDCEGIRHAGLMHFVFHPSSSALTMYGPDGFITKFKIKEPK